MVIGLDCADPDLVFHRWLEHLPNLRRVLQAGVHGPLRSSTPPITVPAWMSMVTGKDPGELGFYGFRNRADHGYERLSLVTSASVHEPTVWDLLGAAGKRSVVIGVPPSYPVRPVRGELVSCFLTPEAAQQWTHPHALSAEIRRLVGDYMVDVRGFRTDRKRWLLEQIYEMTEKRFTVARHLLRSRQWDFFMMVEMGTDRIHHGFWQYMDPDHVLYPGPNEFEDAIFQYYRRVDELLGGLLEFADDDTRVLIVSDHGAKRMDGGIAINEWLIQQGYLVLKRYPDRPTKFEQLEVDWPRTRAWSEGGYYARLFLNVRGREPQGAVDPAEYESVRRRIGEELEALGDEQGRPIGTRVVVPSEEYAALNNVAPDLLLFFGDLFWRSVGTVGGGRVHTRENDTGPDGANHDWNGIFLMAEGRDLGRGGNGARIEGLGIGDVAPTILDAFGLSGAHALRGRAVRPAEPGMAAAG
ncbi:MAG TPA: alkaline phosphatase family protein [Longimicrobium sp.]|jgi:predicted AlkP superfamily phosphohydrolase/phosphomutase|uniref:alkaline phosphatase family protein n=1 Tax=Longimicrobium sp. TaxID=2029185 RepID=UPI002ED96110